MSLDFSALNRISNQDKAEELEKTPTQESFILQAPINGSILSAEACIGSEQYKVLTQAKNATETKIEPNTGISDKLDYETLYKMVFDYHMRNYPPVIDIEYWRTHIPGEDDCSPAEDGYWRSAQRDATETIAPYKNDTFAVDLLSCAYAELEREYKSMRARVSPYKSF